MEIIRDIKIILEDTEITALQTLKDAFVQCETDDCFECLECPLYVDTHCIAALAEKVLNKQTRR